MKYKFGALAIIIAVIIIVFAYSSAFDDTHIPNKIALKHSVDDTLNQDTTSTTLLPVTAAQQNIDSKQAPQSEQASESLSPIDRIRAIQDKTALHQSILKDHEHFSRYPAHNRRFDSLEDDPTKKRYTVDERTTFNEEKTLALTAWTNAKFYLQNETIQVFVTLQDDQQNTIATQFAGHLIYNERDSLASYDFIDANQDGIYELSIPVMTEDKALEAGIYKLLIVNSHNDMVESVAFVITEPQAQLTGQFRDRINPEGHLEIELEIDVQEANRYYLEGSLYSSTDDAIGQSSHAENLDQGRHWLPLTFFGLMLHDAGEPGPYILKHLSLSRVVMPMQRVPLISPDYYTDSYTLDQFSHQRFAE